MKNKLFYHSITLSTKRLLNTVLLLCFLPLNNTYPQPAIMPWGNIRSFHLHGEKMNFETSIRSVKTDWSGCISSERCNWQGTQTYEFSGNTTTMSHFLQALPLNYAEKFIEVDQNSVNVEVSVDATAEIEQAGTYFCFEIPGSEFLGGELNIYSRGKEMGSVTLKTSPTAGKPEYIRTDGNRIIIKTHKREYEVVTDRNTEIIVRQNFIDRPGFLNDPLPAKEFVDSYPGVPVADYQVYFALIKGKAKKGDKRNSNFTINVKGSIDSEAVRITVDPSKPGRAFKGVGSNYRVRNLGNDSTIINYCLNNIRVSWGRIEFNWKEWHPEESEDPLKYARSGKLSDGFYNQIEVARILAKRNIPVIITIWSPPIWATDTARHNRQGFFGWFIRQIIDGEEIKLFGDGSQIRDFSFVSDTVDAFLTAGANDNAFGNVYNLGGAERFSLKALVELMINIYGSGSYSTIPFPEDRKIIDIGDFYANYEKIKNEFGWSPEINLEEGIKKTFTYFTKFKRYYW